MVRNSPWGHIEVQILDDKNPAVVALLYILEPNQWRGGIGHGWILSLRQFEGVYELAATGRGKSINDGLFYNWCSDYLNGDIRQNQDWSRTTCH